MNRAVTARDSMPTVFEIGTAKFTGEAGLNLSRRNILFSRRYDTHEHKTHETV